MPTRLLVIPLLALLFAASACDGTGEDDDAGIPDGGALSGDAGEDDGADAGIGVVPVPPALGAQVDRVGRPGLTTLLIQPFTFDAEARDAARDAYNEADRSTWASTFTEPIRAALAVFDGFDGTCGDQLAADDASPRYTALATLLADDRLLVDTAAGTCTQYLGVELAAMGAVVSGGCGGRTPTVDAIDVTYSLLIRGEAGGVGDGVDADADGAPSGTDFPFLRAP